MVILVDVRSLSFCIQHYNPSLNNEGLKLYLDLLEERHKGARIRASAYKEKMARYYKITSK
jgi:hypothetical protein